MGYLDEMNKRLEEIGAQSDIQPPPQQPVQSGMDIASGEINAYNKAHQGDRAQIDAYKAQLNNAFNAAHPAQQPSGLQGPAFASTTPIGSPEDRGVFQTNPYTGVKEKIEIPNANSVVEYDNTQPNRTNNDMLRGLANDGNLQGFIPTDMRAYTNKMFPVREKFADQDTERQKAMKELGITGDRYKAHLDASKMINAGSRAWKQRYKQYLKDEQNIQNVIKGYKDRRNELAKTKALAEAEKAKGNLQSTINLARENASLKETAKQKEKRYARIEKQLDEWRAAQTKVALAGKDRKEQANSVLGLIRSGVMSGIQWNDKELSKADAAALTNYISQTPDELSRWHKLFDNLDINKDGLVKTDSSEMIYNFLKEASRRKKQMEIAAVNENVPISVEDMWKNWPKQDIRKSPAYSNVIRNGVGTLW